MTPRDPAHDVHDPGSETDGYQTTDHDQTGRDFELHRALVADLAGLLDLDAGLDDILLDTHHQDLVRETTRVLDVPAGLADIIAVDPAAMPSFTPEPPGPVARLHQADAPDPHTTEPSQIAALFSSSSSGNFPSYIGNAGTSSGLDDGARLRVRTHREFHRLLETLRLLHDVTPSDRVIGGVWIEEITMWQDHSTNAATWSGHFGNSVLLGRLLAWIDSWYPATVIGGEPEDRLRTQVMVGDHRAIRVALTRQAEALGREVFDVPFAIDDERSQCFINPALTQELTFVVRPAGRAIPVATRELLAALDSLTLDFTDADLRQTDLTGLDLEGVQWSSRTRWPADWEVLIAEHSEDIGHDLYEVRHRGMLHGARPW